MAAAVSASVSVLELAPVQTVGLVLKLATASLALLVRPGAPLEAVARLSPREAAEPWQMLAARGAVWRGWVA